MVRTTAEVKCGTEVGVAVGFVVGIGVGILAVGVAKALRSFL